MAEAQSAASQSADGSRIKRRTVLVNPGLQLATLIPLGVFLLTLGLALSFYAFETFQQAARDEPDPMLREILAAQVRNVQTRVWTVIAVSALIAAIVAVFRAQRLAGPLHRLARALKSLSRGATVDMHFRRGDYLHEFEEIVAVLSESMHAVTRRNRDQLIAMQQQIRSLHLRLGQGEVPRMEIRDVTSSLLTQFERMPDVASGLHRRPGDR